MNQLFRLRGGDQRRRRALFGAAALLAVVIGPTVAAQPALAASHSPVGSRHGAPGAGAAKAAATKKAPARARVALTESAPAAPGNVHATAGIRNVTVTWDAATGTNHYVVTLSDNFHFCRVTVTQCTIGGLTAGNSYYATVVAFDSVDDSSSSPDSSPSETVIPGPPNPVQSQSAAITGSGTATVQWVRPTNHNAVIDHYTVTSTPPGFGCASVAYANDDNPVLCNVTGLVAGTAYTFQIVAVGATGTGSSNSVSTGSITSGPPTVPQNVTATSTGLLAVRVTWSPPAITGPGITNYTVTSTPASSTCTQASSPCDFAGLTDTTSYVFHVQANGASSSGTSTADSAPIIAGSTTAPTAVTVATTAANTVRVTWGAPAVNAAHVASYSVTSSPPSTTCVTASPCDFTTLTPGTSYVFHVVAVGSAGYGNSPAADSSPIVPGPPSAPQNVTAAVTSAANVHVSWTRPANLGNGVATYTVTSTPGSAGCAGVAYVANDNPVGCDIAGLTTTQSYVFHVVAVGTNSSGTSVAGDALAVIPGPPDAPSPITVTTTGRGAVHLAWVRPAVRRAGIANYTVSSTPASAGCASVAYVNDDNPVGCDITGLDSHQTYVFHVYSVGLNSSGTSAAGDSAVTPVGPPDAPANATATITAANTATVSWTRPAFLGAGIASYTVTSTPASDGCSGVAYVANNNPVTCQVANLTAGTNYTFHVFAVGSSGSGTSDAADTVTVTSGPPSAPRTVTATVTSTGNVHVSWIRPINLGPGVANYTVTSTPGGFGCATVAYVNDDSTVGCDVSGLTSTQSYVFHVVANGINASGPSPAGDAPAVVPGPPGAPGTIVVTTPGPNTAHISWVRPASTGSSGIASYTVTSTPASAGCPTVAYVANDNPVTCDIAGLDSHQSYVFHIVANGVGNSGTSPVGDSQSTPVGPPDAPASVNATITAANQATVTWVRPALRGAGIASYTVTSTPASAGCSGVAYVNSGATVSCVVDGLTAGTGYVFHVVAVGSNSSGTSVAADTGTVTSGPPSAPRTVTATVTGSGNVTVSWIRPTTVGQGIADYTVTANAGTVICASVAYVANDNPVTCNATGLTATTSYTFHVYANGTGSSGTSVAGDSAAVTAGPPGAPGSVTVTTIAANTVHVSWVRPANLGAAGIANYTVTSTPSSAGCATVAYVANDNPVGCDIAGLNSHQTYVFHVVANGASSSGTSPAADSGSTPVGPPDGPASVSATITGPHEATVHWVRPTLRGAGIDHYTVTVNAGTAVCASVAYVANDNPLTCVASNLVSGTAYTFHVVAVGSNSSGSSVAVDATPVTAGPPDAPVDVRVVTDSSGTVHVSWVRPANQGAGIDHYTVTSAPTSDGCPSVDYVDDDTPVGCDITGLDANQTYVFSVVAVGTGLSGTSAAAVAGGGIVPTGRPSPPTDVQLVPGDFSLTVTWTGSDSPGPGIVRYTATADNGGAVCATPSSAETSCTITGLAPGTAYTVTVVANGAGGNDSLPSDTSDQATPTAEPMTGSIVRNADGRLVMFSRGTNNALYQNIQATVGGSTWSGWTSLSGSLAGDPIAIRNADGRVQVFVFGTDGALWYKIQATPGSATWSTNYVGLGGNTLRKTSLVVQMNTDGRVELFGRGTNNAIWHRYQTTPGGSWNADWVSLNGQLAGDPTVILNPDGRLDVYARAFDGKIWHITQVSPSVSTTWSAWASLGSGSIASMGSRAESVTGRMHRRFRQENAG